MPGAQGAMSTTGARNRVPSLDGPGRPLLSASLDEAVMYRGGLAASETGRKGTEPR